MSTPNAEAGMKDWTDKATRERLEKDVAAVKSDIAALTDQITDALNTFANSTGKQARRGYRQARENMDSAMDDMSERGSAMMEAAQDPTARSRRRWKRRSRSDRSRPSDWRSASAS
jgi:hypothetical protein